MQDLGESPAKPSWLPADRRSRNGGRRDLDRGQSRSGRDEPQEKKTQLIPKRVLGKTGVEVSMLNLGTWRSPGLDRLLKFAWANGVRYYDTARSYGSEPAIGKWLTENPENRKEIFLVTKDEPANDPQQLITLLDERLKALKTDYIDLVFIHALGDHHGTEQAVEMAQEAGSFKETIETIKKSGKAKFVGFSTHHATRRRSSRPRRKAAWSTRSCSSTPPGWTRTPRSTRPSTPATRRGSA